MSVLILSSINGRVICKGDIINEGKAFLVKSFEVKFASPYSDAHDYVGVVGPSDHASVSLLSDGFEIYYPSGKAVGETDEDEGYVNYIIFPITAFKIL